MEKSMNNRACFFMLPAILLLGFVAVIPLITALNFSFHDVLGFKTKVWVAFCLVCMSMPLLIPWNMIPVMWRTFLTILEKLLFTVGVHFDWKLNASHTWISIVLMDIWHWTSLVILLCYTSLSTIPDAYYQAAAIDGASRWNVFRYVELPRMKGVLMMALLLRFIDSFMVYIEPYRLNSGGAPAVRPCFWA
jgi:glycerol transport system permease protein